MSFVIWFKDIKKEDVALVGGKGANLGEMYNSKFPIPPGFCVSAEAYDFFIKKTGIKKKISSLLKKIKIEETESLQKASEAIQEIILNSKMPDELIKEIEDAYKHLDVDIDLYKVVNKSTLSMIKAGRTIPFIAARSSATAEDLPEASFAGQQATYLNVKGAKNVVNAVRKCFASLFTARAIYYREKNKFKHMDVKLSVVIQKMINSEKSGVMFSANPATNNKDEIVIEAGFGLGEAVVSGAINPDNYIITKEPLKLKNKTINEQDWMFVKDEKRGVTIKKKLPESRKKEQVLRDEEILNLARIGKKIEEHYKAPMDIEFGVESNKLYILQARAITTLKKEQKPEEPQPESQESSSSKINAPQGKILLKGLAASKGLASGKVKIVKDPSELSKVEKGDILVAEMTNPDYVIAMEKSAAIVTDEGGLTAHASIVSRELGIPCIVGTGTATSTLKEGQEITVDGTKGEVYEGATEIKEQEQKEPEKVHYDTITKVKVICDLPEKAEYASKTGAQGIGLVRIEFMIAKNGIHPMHYIKENKQEEYTAMLEQGLEKLADAFKNKPVWIRTSDIRSDEYKNLKGGDLVEQEPNPMIGWHGIRMGLDEKNILLSEFKAVKKLHDKGYKNLGVMIPFVTHIDQIKKAKEIMKEAGLEPVKDVEFGVMIETPASIWMIDEICKQGISFISFGTNDLTQTILGVDRNNEKIQNLYNEMNPAVLKAIEQVIKTCKSNNVETSICGQAGSKEEMVEFLVEKGIDSISANMDSVASVWGTVSKVEKKLILENARKNNN